LGLRNGSFITWFPNEIQELDAYYTDDVPDKDWVYFDEGGSHLYTLRFELGKLLNPAVRDSMDRIKAKIFKTKGESIPDPEKFMQNPDEYMRLMQNR
jgi:hypothetical protein